VVRPRVERSGLLSHRDEAMRIPLAGASLPGTSRRFSPAPHPARACGRGYPDTSPASPAPPGGGSARAYIRGAAVSGVQPVGSRALDRGDIATGGGGSRGGGTRSPSPVSNAPTILLLAGLPHPTRASAGKPYASAGTPTPPAPSALLPRPAGWGQCPGVYQGNSRIRGATGGKPCTGPWGYRHGGWRLAGRGNSFPLPCL